MRRRFDMCVYGYVVMPEHVHLLLSEPERSGSENPGVAAASFLMPKVPGAQVSFAQVRPTDGRTWGTLTFKILLHGPRQPVTFVPSPFTFLADLQCPTSYNRNSGPIVPPRVVDLSREMGEHCPRKFFEI